jgi:hypothetical protein
MARVIKKRDFYRVVNRAGETLQDFRTKREAKKYAKKKYGVNYVQFSLRENSKLWGLKEDER